jgi:hypothetical protein
VIPAKFSIAAVLFAATLLGCSREDPAPPEELPQVQRGTAVLTGRVTLLGTPPAPKQTTIACDPRPDARQMVHTDKTIVVSPTGGLADVYVYITTRDGAALKGSGKSEAPKVLDQVDCYFVPQALAVQIGQPIRIRNSDPTFHNVHWDPKLNRAVNLGFPPAPNAPERVIALAHAEFMAVRCDVHPWMTSSIAVFDHPFFATTDADGNFRIEGLPPGTYQVTAYHAHYLQATIQTFTVSDAPARIDFQYTHPPAP